jgi:hypothetical protein
MNSVIMTKRSDEIPAVIWPQTKGNYKYVLVEIRGNHYLRFQEEELNQHGLILKKLLDNLHIGYDTFRHSKETIPEQRKEGEYEAKAMGIAAIRPKGDVFLGLDDSMAYDMTCEASEAMRILSELAPQKNFIDVYRKLEEMG